jgi:hypothetical protein
MIFIVRLYHKNGRIGGATWGKLPNCETAKWVPGIMEIYNKVSRRLEHQAIKFAERTGKSLQNRQNERFRGLFLTLFNTPIGKMLREIQGVRFWE